MGRNTNSGGNNGGGPLRIASSTAHKAHSWRGDHPMKTTNFFHSSPHEDHNNNSGAAQQQRQSASGPGFYGKMSKSYNPYKDSPHLAKSARPGGQGGFARAAHNNGGKINSHILHHGIKLVGLAPPSTTPSPGSSPNDHKQPRN